MNIENTYLNPEDQFKAEEPYYTQLSSWREGMQYRYSPDSYPITQDQFGNMSKSGELMGKVLDGSLGNQVLEFRIDFVCAKDGQLYITEVQTDDRGLPAMISTRNSRGTPQPEQLPGIIKPFVERLTTESGREDFELLITYPDKEGFYYSGFPDVARTYWEQNPKASFLVSPRSKVNPDQNGNLLISVENEGLQIQTKPDFVWNFSPDPLEGFRVIQPMVNKQVLLDTWQSQDPLYQRLRRFTPETRFTNQDSVLNQKDQWILKPLDGRWSKGIVIGKNVSFAQWCDAISRNANLIAQRFIPPRRDAFLVRDKKGNYRLQDMYSRVEGYYCRTPEGWKLVDILATCTPDIPVHGKRDCIMIPGVIIEK